MAISDDDKNKVITVDNLNEFYTKFKGVLTQNYLSTLTFQQFAASYGNNMNSLSLQIGATLSQAEGITVISTQIPTKISNLTSVIKSHWP